MTLKKAAAFLTLALLVVLAPAALTAQTATSPAPAASPAADCTAADLQTPAADTAETGDAELPDFLEAPQQAAPGCTSAEIQACNQQCNVPYCEAITFYINNQCSCYCRCRV